MKKLIWIILLLPFGTSAQDIHFTQMQTSPMLLNPAYTGLFEGWERISANHRSQWMGAGTNFHTTAIGVDVNFFKTKQADRAHMGVGAVFYNDVGGDSKFGTKQALFNFSALVPITERQMLSAGLTFGIGQQSGDMTNLLFPSQFNGNELDPFLSNGEVNALVSKMYTDVGVGVMYRFGNNKVGFARDDQTDFRIGVAYTHLNRPNVAFVTGFKQPIYAKWIINTSFLKDIQDSPVGFHLMFNQFLQGPHSESVAAALIRYRLSTGSKTTGLKRDAYISGGMYFRFGDAVAPAVFVQWNGFDFGFSYDITISKLGAVQRTGGIEFSLSYSNLDFALFKRRRR